MTLNIPSSPWRSAKTSHWAALSGPDNLANWRLSYARPLPKSHRKALIEYGIMAGAVRFNSNRLGLIAIAIIITFILFQTTEFRKRSWSCKTLSSCIGPGVRPHTYHHWDNVDENLKVATSEKTFRDGTVLFHRQTEDSDPEILVLVLNKDEHSWSKDFRSTSRNIYDFVDLLVSTDLDFTKVTLGLMTSSREQFDAAKKATQALPFGRVALFYREDHGPDIDYSDRHNPDVQLQRRAAIAGLRNYLMLRALRDERHIVWIDADIVELSGGIVQAMVGHAARRADVGIVTALCSQTLTYNYDKNAWALDRRAPPLLGPVADDQRDAAVAQLVATRTYVDELITGTRDADLVPLDSVGGTILYVRAELVRQGVNFPTFNVVGTTWSRDGWIGVETEGICYQASRLQGGGCFVLGGSHSVRHADQS
ncbi:Anp1-domain-containing protein [Biscogniauxia marginata]|nr:Anp1-domain-containing protein [Biscogniauxia marginata]